MCITCFARIALFEVARHQAFELGSLNILDHVRTNGHEMHSNRYDLLVDALDLDGETIVPAGIEISIRVAGEFAIFFNYGDPDTGAIREGVLKQNQFHFIDWAPDAEEIRSFASIEETVEEAADNLINAFRNFTPAQAVGPEADLAGEDMTFGVIPESTADNIPDDLPPVIQKVLEELRAIGVDATVTRLN